MFDDSVGALFLTYAARLVRRGYVHNSLGNLAIRVPHPGHEHGVVYTKHAGVSLEEATLDHLVVTEVVSPRLLHGTRPTSVARLNEASIVSLPGPPKAIEFA